MIILPDRNIPRARILMPMKRSFWSPSSYMPKDQLGNDTTRYKFIATTRYHDGKIAWQGVFEDRDDFDAFAFAYASGSLRYERDLWRLPTPEWIPGIYDELPTTFAVTVFLSSTSFTSLTYSVPVDWTTDNVVHCIGSGGSGGVAYVFVQQAHSSGGGEGGYGRKRNINVPPGGTTSYACGPSASIRNISTSGTAATGFTGWPTFFGNTTYATSPVGGNGGGPGQGSASSGVSIVGGTGGSGIGDVVYTGGAGGDVGGQGGTVTQCASGGGGAAGLNGNGGAGGSIAVAAPSQATSGGTGDAGTGGTSGAAGTELSGTYGSGGGGTGVIVVGGGGATGGAAGNYGGGGGAAACNNGSPAVSGASKQGIIHIVYIPFGMRFNMPMLGM